MLVTLNNKLRAGLLAASVGLSFCSTVAFAQAPLAGAPAGAQGVAAAPPAAQFNQRKAFTLSALTARESVLAKEKACVQATTTVAQLESCREKAKETRKDMHEKVQAQAVPPKK